LLVLHPKIISQSHYLLKIFPSLIIPQLFSDSHDIITKTSQPYSKITGNINDSSIFLSSTQDFINMATNGIQWSHLSDCLLRVI